MTIKDRLRNLINSQGFIYVDQMMKEALSANASSYYKKPNILGENGDFITSPEVSQLFGEIIGLWAIEQWQKLGYPPYINLVELGPGRGLLMRDLLRTAILVPAFYQAINIQLLEINPYLVQEQKANLASADKLVLWLRNIKELTPYPTILIANEFFDALPIKQYIKQNDYWHEIVLTVDHDLDHFVFATTSADPDKHEELTKKHHNATHGAIIEESAESLKFITDIAEHFKSFSGSALIIDYGYNIDYSFRSRYQYNSTLQAVKKHKFQPVLASLGDADLSAHIDFYALHKHATKLNINTEPLITQSQFLNKHGIELRLELLCQKLDAKYQPILRKQVERLTAKQEMGKLFKVLVINKF